MPKETVIIEEMIAEGSMTLQDAVLMGYHWDAVVTGGDAVAMRQRWLQQQSK